MKRSLVDNEGRFAFNVPVTREIIAASVNFVPVLFLTIYKIIPSGEPKGLFID